MEKIVERSLRVPILTWLPRHEIDHAAMAQLRLAARHPVVSPHIAVMPDCHPGVRVTIGCVLPAHGAVIPSAVGSDIGCGMTAISTGVELDELEMPASFWRNWAAEIRSRIPLGSASHDDAQPDWEGFDADLADDAIARRLLDHTPRTIGTLGGGNHFLEAQVDDENHIWFMVHSGSRVAGTIIHDHYDRIARQTNLTEERNAPGQLWWLRTDEEAGRAYLNDMQWATRYASENRRRMLFQMLAAFGVEMKDAGGVGAIHDCCHNFARHESHYDQDFVVHRKGATSASESDIALIPGSMGTGSYVTEGLGNQESFRSCSHGAGRVMSRSDARAHVDLEDLEIALYLSGAHTRPTDGLINEAPQAYKSIDAVMDRQRDLVRIVHRLRPLMTIKG